MLTTNMGKIEEMKHRGRTDELQIGNRMQGTRIEDTENRESWRKIEEDPVKAIKSIEEEERK